MLVFDNFESFEKATTAWQNIAGQKTSLKYFSNPVPILKGKMKVKEDTSWKQIPHLPLTVLLESFTAPFLLLFEQLEA